MNDTPIYIPAQDWDAVEDLPQGWEASPGWRYAKRVLLTNETADERRSEPIEADVDFHSGHITDLVSEVRVARAVGDAGPLEEVPSQVQLIAREDDVLRCRLFFLADVAAKGSSTYLVLYGNPSAAEPAYETDLAVSGESVRLKEVPLEGTAAEVAGRADVLVCPGLDTANVLYKVLMEITRFGLASMAGITVGLPVPYVILSRADSVETRLLSIALGSLARERMPDYAGSDRRR